MELITPNIEWNDGTTKGSGILLGEDNPSYAISVLEVFVKNGLGDWQPTERPKGHLYVNKEHCSFIGEVPHKFQIQALKDKVVQSSQSEYERWLDELSPDIRFNSTESELVNLIVEEKQ